MSESETPFQLSLGPDELSSLKRVDFVETVGATVQINRGRCQPYARVIDTGADGGIFFAVCLSEGTKIHIPDPGEERIMAFIPDRRIDPRGSLAAERFDELIGKGLGGISLVAHGPFED